MSSPMQPPQHLARCPATICVQVEDARLEHLLAAERQQLARERGRALARLLDLLESARIGSSGLEVAQQQLAVAEDHR